MQAVNQILLIGCLSALTEDALGSGKPVEEPGEVARFSKRIINPYADSFYFFLQLFTEQSEFSLSERCQADSPGD